MDESLVPAIPKILKQREIAKTQIFCVEQLDIRFANGAEVCYERLKGSDRGAVLIVPMLDDDTVLLVKEYAAGVHRYELGLPKGKIEADETVEQAANREIMEEIGFAAKKLKQLTSYTLAPGYLSHTTHIVLAEGLYEQRRQGDEPEELEVIPWRLSDLATLFARDDCTEARSIAALFWVRELKRQQSESI